MDIVCQQQATLSDVDKRDDCDGIVYFVETVIVEMKEMMVRQL